MTERFRVLSKDEAVEAGLYEESRWEEHEYFHILYDFGDPNNPKFIASDKMEPEDANFWRDLAWVPRLLNEVSK